MSEDSKFSFIGTLIGAIAGSTSDFSGGRGRVNAQATQDIKNDAFERKLKQNQNASDRIIKDGKTDANKKIVELQKLSNENTNAISGQISKIDAKLNNTISRVSTIETGLGDLNRALKKLSKENGKDEFQKVTFANHEKRIKQLEKVNGISNANGSIFDLLGRMSKNKWLRLLGKGGIIGSALAAAGYLTYREFRARGQDREKDIDLIMKRLDSIQDPKSPAGRKAIADAARESKRVKQLSGMELRENKSKLIEQKKRIATKAREGGNVRFGAIQSIEAELDELQGKQMSSAQRNAAVARILRKNPGLKEQDLGPGYARQVDRARAWEKKDLRKSKRNIRTGAYGTMDDDSFDMYSGRDYGPSEEEPDYMQQFAGSGNQKITRKTKHQMMREENNYKNIRGSEKFRKANKRSNLGANFGPPLPTQKPVSWQMSQSGTGLVKQRQQLTGMSAQQHQDYQEKKQFLKFGALPGGFEHVDGNRGILGKPMAVMAGGAQARGSGGGGGGAQARGSGGGGGFGGGPGSSSSSYSGSGADPSLDLSGSGEPPKDLDMKHPLTQQRSGLGGDRLGRDQKLHFYATMVAELGPDATEKDFAAIMETPYNRGMTESDKNIMQNITAAYYEPLRKHRGGYRNYQNALAKLRSDPKFFSKLDRAHTQVIRGSNYSKLATQNSSAGVASNARKNQTIHGKTSTGETLSSKNRMVGAVPHGLGTVRNTQAWQQKTNAALKKYSTPESPTALADAVKLQKKSASPSKSAMPPLPVKSSGISRDKMNSALSAQDEADYEDAVFRGLNGAGSGSLGNTIADKSGLSSRTINGELKIDQGQYAYDQNAVDKLKKAKFDKYQYNINNEWGGTTQQKDWKKYVGSRIGGLSQGNAGGSPEGSRTLTTGDVYNANLSRKKHITGKVRFEGMEGSFDGGTGGRKWSMPYGVHKASRMHGSGRKLSGHFNSMSRYGDLGRGRGRGADVFTIGSGSGTMADPRLRRNRTAIQGHPGIGGLTEGGIRKMISSGCLAIKPHQYKDFVKQYRTYQQANNGKVWLKFMPSAKGQPHEFVFTNKPPSNLITVDQATANYANNGDVQPGTANMRQQQVAKMSTEERMEYIRTRQSVPQEQTLHTAVKGNPKELAGILKRGARMGGVGRIGKGTFQGMCGKGARGVTGALLNDSYFAKGLGGSRGSAANLSDTNDYLQKSGYYNNREMVDKKKMHDKAFLASLPIGTVISNKGGSAGHGHVQVKLANGKWASDAVQNKVLTNGNYHTYAIHRPNAKGFAKMKPSVIGMHQGTMAAMQQAGMSVGSPTPGDVQTFMNEFTSDNVLKDEESMLTQATIEGQGSYALTEQKGFIGPTAAHDALQAIRAKEDNARMGFGENMGPGGGGGSAAPVAMQPRLSTPNMGPGGGGGTGTVAPQPRLSAPDMGPGGGAGQAVIDQANQTPPSAADAITASMDVENTIQTKEVATETAKKDDAERAAAKGPPGSGGNNNNNGGGRRTPERSFPKAGDAGVGGSSKCWV